MLHKFKQKEIMLANSNEDNVYLTIGRVYETTIRNGQYSSYSLQILTLAFCVEEVFVGTSVQYRFNM